MKISSRAAKHFGELAELRFLLRCRELGLLIARPQTELARYDFLVDTQITTPTGTAPLHHPFHKAAIALSPATPLAAPRQLPRRHNPASSRQSTVPPLAALPPPAPILRVQVKSTAYRQPLATRRRRANPNSTRDVDTYGAWRINLLWSARGIPYTPADFDLLAAYIHPLDIWYLIPATHFTLGGPRQRFHGPRRPNPRPRQLLLSPEGLPRYAHWEPFRENWSILAPGRLTAVG